MHCRRPIRSLFANPKPHDPGPRRTRINSKKCILRNELNLTSDKYRDLPPHPQTRFAWILTTKQAHCTHALIKIKSGRLKRSNRTASLNSMYARRTAIPLPAREVLKRMTGARFQVTTVLKAFAPVVCLLLALPTQPLTAAPQQQSTSKPNPGFHPAGSPRQILRELP